MIEITVGKTETRQGKQFESDKYKVEIKKEIENPEKLEQEIDSLFNLIKSQIEKQKVGA
jgi:hypothetical protein